MYIKAITRLLLKFEETCIDMNGDKMKLMETTAETFLHIFLFFCVWDVFYVSFFPLVSMLQEFHHMFDILLDFTLVNPWHDFALLFHLSCNAAVAQLYQSTAMFLTDDLVLEDPLSTYN